MTELETIQVCPNDKPRVTRELMELITYWLDLLNFGLQMAPTSNVAASAVFPLCLVRAKYFFRFYAMVFICSRSLCDFSENFCPWVYQETPKEESLVFHGVTLLSQTCFERVTLSKILKQIFRPFVILSTNQKSKALYWMMCHLTLMDKFII